MVNYVLSSITKSVARLKEEICGVIVCKLDSDRGLVRRGYIAMLAVSPAMRKRGIGRQLTRKAIEAMDEMGCDEVGLETPYTNTGALRLYETLGFVRGNFKIILNLLIFQFFRKFLICFI